jgi:hypothetical protein
MTRTPLYFVLLAIACTGGDTDAVGTDTSESDTDSDTDADTDADTDVDPNQATVTGTITLPGGGPADHYRVNICRDVCITVASDSSGNFVVEGLDPNVWSFYVLAYGDSAYSVPYGPITLGVGEAYTQDMELVANTGSVQLQVGQPAAIGTFGTLTVSSAFETSLGDAVDTLTYTAPLTSAQRTADSINGEVVETMIYLGTFEAEGEAVLNIAKNDIEPGSTRNVYIAELPETSGWTAAGTVEAQGNGEMMMGDIAVKHFTAIAVTIPNE